MTRLVWIELSARRNLCASLWRTRPFCAVFKTNNLHTALQNGKKTSSTKKNWGTTCAKLRIRWAPEILALGLCLPQPTWNRAIQPTNHFRESFQWAPMELEAADLKDTGAFPLEISPRLGTALVVTQLKFEWALEVFYLLFSRLRI